VLARVIEAAGIPTVTVTMMPELAARYRSSRIVGVEFPYGHSFGIPGAADMQRRVLTAAIELLTTATEAETRHDLDEDWPIDRKVAYKAWHPPEPSPIVAHSIEELRTARRDAAQADG